MEMNKEKEAVHEDGYTMQGKRQSTSNRLVKNLSILSLIIIFTGAFYQVFNSITKPTKQLSADFAITDSAEVQAHLESLRLTPNHSVKIFTRDSNGISKEKILHGRFLHITDMHPDELNVIGGAIRRKCHKKLKSVDSESDISHKYGDAMSGCDSPIDLYDSTLKWVRENLKDHIDFVIWTGDNIRHDNDRTNPRTEPDIFDMNERVANDFETTFMDAGEENERPDARRVKIIPSLGNNDVYPHNLFSPGPTLQTREMYKIWRNFIPTEQMHTFDRGAYFFREVVPGKLVVVSINTLYWFQSNPLNDNCDARKQPGYKLFLWLGATLKECRRRNLKVWLSGHVPPIPKNIHHSCYAKISVWMHEYRDVIIGGVWGHMNIDHWVPLDSVKAWRSIEKRLLSLGVLDANNKDALPYIDYDQIGALTEDAGDSINDMIDTDDSDDFDTVEDLYHSFGINTDDETDSPLHIFSDRYMGAPSAKVSYLQSIRDSMYTKLKGRKKGGEFSERYAIAHISSSVIPTYNPGMRVWEYNVTEFNSLNINDIDTGNKFVQIYHKVLHYFAASDGQNTIFQENDWNDFFIELENELDNEAKLEQLLSEMENDGETFTTETHLYSPSNDKTIPKLMPEDLPLGPAYIPQPFTPEKYVQYYIDLNEHNYERKDTDNWKFAYKVHYSTDEDYGSGSLLVSDWVRLGRKLAKTAPPANGEDNKVGKKIEESWKKYIDRAFISSGYQNLEGAYK